MNAGGVPNTCKSYEKSPACRREYSGGRVSNAWAIYFQIGDNPAKAGLIPDSILQFRLSRLKVTSTSKLPFGNEPACH